MTDCVTFCGGKIELGATKARSLEFMLKRVTRGAWEGLVCAVVAVGAMKRPAFVATDTGAVVVAPVVTGFGLLAGDGVGTLGGSTAIDSPLAVDLAVSGMVAT